MKCVENNDDDDDDDNDANDNDDDDDDGTRQWKTKSMLMTDNDGGWYSMVLGRR